MKFNTKTIHAGLEPDSATGAIMTPIYQTSTFVQESVGVNKGFEYARSHNPTRSALEANLAQLENGKFGACFGSGLAAIDCVLKMLSPGDEVISTSDLYGGSYRLFNTIFAKYGIKFHYTAMDDASKVKALINENTKLVWVETPTNPMLNIIDIEAIANVVKGSKAMLAVDNTFSTPYIQRPLELGADIVMHSVTKYLGGHSDVVMGALVTSDEKIAKEMYRIQNSSGAVCGPQDAFLVLRGVKTLHLRMQRHSENGEKVANWLTKNPAVDKVYYPGLPNHKNHAVAKKQMSAFSGMVSFTLKTDTTQAAHAVLSKCKLFALAESLGGVESLIGHPATMTHASIPADARRESGVVDSLIRLSVGVEDIEDLIADLDAALK
ncbi:cystathionine gamma-synthase [Cryomorpha ignava]|uniref:Cystathionine gamma-synthase n=1 Tax=Cryomorpha ignava TaxID=101383 RepID=A0A7K3WQS9_9FLAO|nr:cystathionine gamma-synthase [Cryomorpha ignava]NEN23878.1 cystathionine gamma-synthase [Cryomorpha ignava]